MALMSPATTAADVDLHTEVFREAPRCRSSRPDQKGAICEHRPGRAVAPQERPSLGSVHLSRRAFGFASSVSFRLRFRCSGLRRSVPPVIERVLSHPSRQRSSSHSRGRRVAITRAPGAPSCWSRRSRSSHLLSATSVERVLRPDWLSVRSSVSPRGSSSGPVGDRPGRDRSRGRTDARVRRRRSLRVPDRLTRPRAGARARRARGNRDRDRRRAPRARASNRGIRRSPRAARRLCECVGDPRGGSPAPRARACG